MKQSQLFARTAKTAPKDEAALNAILLERAGYIQKVMAGVYSFLPLGLKVLAKIENTIREEMNAIGAQEVFMPVLHPKENWLATGRWQSLDILFKLKSQHGFEAALGPTHEEIVTPMAGRIIASYKDLPLAVYQIQTKFRDEPRAKSGLLRGREFRMKDLYSFHASEADLQSYYEAAARAYVKIFQRLGLEAIYTEASGGTFSKFSHEFQVEIAEGEDTIYVCNGCGLAKNKEIYEIGTACTHCSSSAYEETKASEVGNIFPLKTKYSDAFGLAYTAEDGSKQPVLMGCYGIGSSRLMGVLVEKFHDGRGIIWPKSVAPFAVHLVRLGKDSEIASAADRLYADLQAKGVEVLYDDREKSAGEKLADSDLLGLPVRLVVSGKTLKTSAVSVETRGKAEKTLVAISEVTKRINDF